MVASTLQRNFNRWAGRTRLYTELKSWHGLNVCTGSGNPYFCPILSTIYTTKASTWGSISIGHCFRISISRVLGELGGGGGLETPTENLKGVCLLAANETRKKPQLCLHTRCLMMKQETNLKRGKRIPFLSFSFLFSFFFKQRNSISSSLEFSFHAFSYVLLSCGALCFVLSSLKHFLWYLLT